MRAWLSSITRTLQPAFSCGLGLLASLALSCRSAPPPDRTQAAPNTPDKPLAAGDPAPDFAALSHIGYSVSARDFGQRPVLVQLCPDGFDPSCAELARSVRDRWLTLNRRLAMALFIVPLGYVESRAFASAEELPFLVLADADRTITRSFGVHDTTKVGFLLGPEQRVARVLAAASGDDYLRELTGALP